MGRLQPDFPAYQASPELLAAIGGIEATPFMLFVDASGRPAGWIRGYAKADRLNDVLVSLAAEPR